MAILIAKSDGGTEPFQPRKLVASLRRAGATEEGAQSINKDIERALYSGITTSEIYRRAFALLRTHRRAAAARYSLKRAVLDFGPSGFPFEAYIAELYRAEGWEAQIDQIVAGACVEHEVDVLLHRPGETTRTYVEAKFHNAAGFKTDLKTVLYVQARIEDIATHDKGARGLVVTNTKFSSQAVQYARCKGLDLLSWDYPEGRSLHERIDKAGLYPITALTTLNHREKMQLLSQRRVLCKALPQDTRALASAGVMGARADAVLEEVGNLCVPGMDR
ncbi:MAG: restriction endonuclease [Patescibacteria group bacterium]|nr:restriction endonuclease [Patescibacteria group bacterium]